MSYPCHSSSLNCQRVTEKFWHYWKMILRPLNIEDRDEALRAHAELARDDFSFLLDAFDENEPWMNFIKRVSATSRGEDLPNGLRACDISRGIEVATAGYRVHQRKFSDNH